jgi:hypothetical protein
MRQHEAITCPRVMDGPGSRQRRCAPPTQSFHSLTKDIPVGRRRGEGEEPLRDFDLDEPQSMFTCMLVEPRIWVRCCYKVGHVIQRLLQDAGSNHLSVGADEPPHAPRKYLATQACSALPLAGENSVCSTGLTWPGAPAKSGQDEHSLAAGGTAAPRFYHAQPSPCQNLPHHGSPGRRQCAEQNRAEEHGASPVHELLASPCLAKPSRSRNKNKFFLCAPSARCTQSQMPRLQGASMSRGGGFMTRTGHFEHSRSRENELLVDMLRSLSISHTQRFFDRRVERVVWSPSCRTALAVGSHGGDVYLWNYEDELRTAKIVDGCGRGGAINDMKFSHDGERLFAVGHDGHFTNHDCETAVAMHTFSTKSFGSVPKQGNCCDHWFTSLSGCENAAQASVLAGDNLGFVANFDRSCQLLNRWKLHKGKVSSIELNPVDRHIFATTSVDRTCSLWDIRKVGSAKGKASVCEPLLSQTFDGAATSACFSHNGQRLLVTSQDCSIRLCQVSSSSEGIAFVPRCLPGWGDAHLQVKHPHRFYQHLTQHRATFHPRSDDLFIIGRFPEKDAAGQDAEKVLLCLQICVSLLPAWNASGCLLDSH